MITTHWEASYTIEPRMLFGKKRCPKCGKRMKLYFKRIPFSPIEKGEREHYYNHPHFGSFHYSPGGVKGHNGYMRLKCKECEVILDIEMYKAVRKIQKKEKRIILTDEEIKSIALISKEEDTKI